MYVVAACKWELFSLIYRYVDVLVNITLFLCLLAGHQSGLVNVVKDSLRQDSPTLLLHSVAHH